MKATKMNRFNKIYLKKFLPFIFILYLVLTALSSFGAIVQGDILQVLTRATFLLPFVLLCLIFCFMAVSGFNKSVKREEEKHSVSFVSENTERINGKQMVFFSDEWLIFAGQRALHYLSVSDISEPYIKQSAKIGGSYYVVVTTDKNKKITVNADNAEQLYRLRAAWKNIKNAE